MQRVAVAVALGLSLICGCSKSSDKSTTVTIGEYGSLTGAEATFGISTDNGAKLAVKQRNSAGGIHGKQVVLETMDDQGKQGEAASVVTRLVQEKHAVAVIGEVASSLSLAGGKVCQQLGVPMVSPSSTNPKVTQIGDMVSRVCFIDSFQGYVVGKFAKESLHLDKAAVLFDHGQAYSTGLKEDFVKAFTGMGGKVVIEQSYGGGDSDFAAQLNAIKNTDAQFVFIPGYYPEVIAISRQARKIGLKLPLTGGDGWVSDKLADAGEALDGCYFSDHYAKEDDRPEVKKFLDAYRAEFHAEPDSMAALGYDAANLLMDAIDKANSTDGKAIAAAVNATKDFKGVTGTITIDQNRNARKAAVVQKLQGGKYAYFTRVDPGQ